MVQDHSNQEEVVRLEEQDRLFTTAMGGVLAEQANFRSVLDVACGTGGWLIETARAYPAIQRLRGVDVSTRMIEYARTRMLEFPLNTFDLVNQRLGMSFLRK